MGWGTNHRSRSPGSAGTLPQQTLEGPPGDLHRGRPDCTDHYDWPALSIAWQRSLLRAVLIGSISRVSSLNSFSRGPSLIGQIRLSLQGLMALLDRLEP